MLTFNITLPHTETPEFFNMFETLIGKDIIKSYRYVRLDLRTDKTEWLPYSLYDTETGTWSGIRKNTIG